MCIIGTTEAESITKRMESRAMVGESQSSQAKICERLLEDNIRVHGVKYKNKYTKRKTEQKTNNRTYHL